MLQKPSTSRTRLRYFLVVVCGYCVDFAIYAAFVALGGSVYWANVLGFCVGSVFNVLLIRTFVFPESRFRLTTDLQLTLLLNGVMFWFGMAVLWGLIELMAVNHYGAKLVANGLTFLGNYTTRALLFRKR